MSNLEASFSILGQKGVMAYILKGTVFTLIIALIAVVLGIVIGSVLALCRNYCTSKKTKIFGMIATVYIEVFEIHRCCCGSSYAWNSAPVRSCSTGNCSG